MVDVPWESEEKRNYICIQSMFTDVVSENLREYFKQEWNTRYQASLGVWDDTNVSGQQLFNKENKRARPNKNMFQSKFQHGDTSLWDCSVLFDAIRFSNSIGSSLNSTITTALDDLRTIRNKFVGHSAKATLSDAEFQAIFSDVENAFKTLGIPVHDLTQIRTKRNLYKSFQVLPPKPTHEVVHRTDQMNEIKQDLEKLITDNDGKLTCLYISGNPGSEKSQLARQLAEDLFEDVKKSTETAYIMTLDAKDVDTLLNSYENLCRRLNCDEYVLQNLLNSLKPKEEKIKDLRSLITTRIKNWKRWWIVVDNVEHLDIISPLLPEMGDEDWNNGQIILTTQNASSVPPDSMLTKHISLSGGMKGNECRQLLSVLSGTDVDDPLLDEVANQLDYQPLAMAAAAVYVKELAGTKFSWRDYLEKLENGKRHVTEKQLSKKNSAYSSTMSAAVFLAVKNSAEKHFILKETFNFFSFISFEPLPIGIIATYIQQVDPNCDKEEIYLEIKQCSLFLVQGNEDHLDVRIHRVVHEAVTLLCKKTRMELDKSSETGVPKKGARVNFPCFVKNVVKALYCFEGRDDQKRMIPHLKAFNRKVKDLLAPQQSWYLLTSYFTKPEIFEIFSFFANCLRKYCEFKLALELQNINLQLYEDSKDDLTLASILLQVCLLNLDLGKFDEAKGHGHRALEIRIKALGSTHVDVGTSYNCLGIIYQEMGKMEQATHYHHRALEIQMKALGPTHVDIATSFNGLGIIYQEMGKMEEAKDYHQRAVEIQKKALGPTHVDVGGLYNNLGNAYHGMGELEKANDSYQLALEIQIKSLGPTHVDVGTSYNNLGLVYCDIRDLKQAKDYHQRVLEIRKKAFGQDHVGVAQSYNNLGLVHHNMGDLQQAKDYHQRALKIKMKALGPTHVKVGSSYNNLGNVCQIMGELEQAKDYYQRALEIQIKSLGPTHVDVGGSYNNLGYVYRANGELEQAKDYHERSLGIVVQALGPTHQKVGHLYKTLENVCQEMGEYEQATNYHRQGLKIRKNH